MYRINSCRGDPARRTGTARWTQKLTGTAIRHRRWDQNGVQTCRWSKVCPHWPAESSARRSRWTGRREASARRWRGSHLRDPPSVTPQHIKSGFSEAVLSFERHSNLVTYSRKLVSKTDPLLLHQNLPTHTTAHTIILPLIGKTPLFSWGGCFMTWNPLRVR